ncbi:MAG: AAA family ATPase [Natronospirillum sp.]|uniref:AAA family ATPase n=1 Tax=Natronospirillum sp. TaxID=2812955 RepID=UPI0025CD4A75|nr:AAA family ATPase [Natronospirillum sp.]MCH8551360.1 AAA family ATPase [Natronospirillum sp.]
MSIDRTLSEAARRVRGKPHQLKLALASALAGGHLLIEDVPGVGKTTLSQTLARVLGLTYRRIQFTSDLVPADILGGAVYSPETRSFSVVKGPIFAQVLLADELNRASPKAQSALLEAMEEEQVSLEGEAYLLPQPFLVMATQNPMDMAGTHALPESQLDRFLISMSMGYPDAEVERELLAGQASQVHYDDLQPILSAEVLQDLRRQAMEVHLSAPLLDYLQHLVRETREHPDVRLGLSPRAALGLTRVAQAWALMARRDYVQPDDLQQVFVPVARHRLQTRQGNDGQRVAEQILADTPIGG